MLNYLFKGLISCQWEHWRHYYYYLNMLLLNSVQPNFRLFIYWAVFNSVNGGWTWMVKYAHSTAHTYTHAYADTRHMWTPLTAEPILHRPPTLQTISIWTSIHRDACIWYLDTKRHMIHIHIHTKNNPKCDGPSLFVLFIYYFFHFVMLVPSDENWIYRKEKKM